MTRTFTFGRQALSSLVQETGVCHELILDSLSRGVTPTVYLTPCLTVMATKRMGIVFDLEELTACLWRQTSQQIVESIGEGLERYDRVVPGLLDWVELSLVGEHKLATLVPKCGDGDLNGLGTEACSCCSAKVACKGMSALYSYLQLWNML